MTIKQDRIMREEKDRYCGEYWCKEIDCPTHQIVLWTTGYRDWASEGRPGSETGRSETYGPSDTHYHNVFVCRTIAHYGLLSFGHVFSDFRCLISVLFWIMTEDNT